MSLSNKVLVVGEGRIAFVDSSLAAARMAGKLVVHLPPTSPATEALLGRPIAAPAAPGMSPGKMPRKDRRRALGTATRADAQEARALIRQARKERREGARAYHAARLAAELAQSG